MKVSKSIIIKINTMLNEKFKSFVTIALWLYLALIATNVFYMIQDGFSLSRLSNLLMTVNALLWTYLYNRDTKY